MPAAIAVMFCSATPALTYWFGKRSANLVSTPKPRSPVISVTMGSASARSVRPRMKASRMVGAALELGNGSGVFVALRVAVVPEHGMLHEAHALALHRMADDDRGAAAAGGYATIGGKKLIVI